MGKKVRVEVVGDNILKIPLAKKGKWKHDSYGIVSFSDEDFNNSVANYKEDALGFEPYVTFGHLNDENPAATDAELKKGNLSKLYIEDDIFYGEFIAKPDAIALVANNDYEYSSAEFVRNLTDKVSGEKRGCAFHRVALTNSPFLPFNTESGVYEKLSIDCSQDIIPFVVKLSINTEIVNPMPEEILPTVEEPAAALATATATVDPAPTTTQLVLNPEALLASIEKLKDSYTVALTGAKETIESLKSEIEQLKNRVANQEVAAQAFSTSVSNQQKEAIYDDLAKQGVAPAVVQAFSQVIGSLDSSNTIKLSLGEGQEKELSVLESVIEMLKQASTLGKVEYQQFGQSNAAPASNGSEGFSKIIQRNKELAQKKLV